MATPLVPSARTPEPVAGLLEKSRLRRLYNDEYFLLLTNHAKFGLTVSHEAPSRPPEGTLFLMNSRACRFFRADGHNWRKKKDGKNVQESHEKLTVGDAKRLNCTYVTAEDLPLKRRCYYLLDWQELEHLVLVHYLHSSASSQRTSSSRRPPRSADLEDLIEASIAAAALAAAGSRGSGSLGDASSAELWLPGSGSMGSGQLQQGLPVQALMPQRAALPGYALGSGEVVAQVGSSDGLALAQPGPPPAHQEQHQQQQEQQYNPNPAAPPYPIGGPPLDGRLYERQISNQFSMKLSLEPERQHQQRSAEAARGPDPAAGQAWSQLQLGPEVPPEHLLSSLRSAGLSLLSSLLSGELSQGDLAPSGDLTPGGHDVWAPGRPYPHPEQQQHQGQLPATGAGLPPLPSAWLEAWQLNAAQAKLLHLLGAQAAQQLQLPAPEAGMLQPGGLAQQDSDLVWFLKQLEEGEEQRQQQEGAGQGDGEAGGQRGSAEHSAGSSSGGSGMRSLSKLDSSTLSWLAPLRRMLSGAGGSAPKLPSWQPDFSLGTPTEREGQRVAAGEAGGAAGGGINGHWLALSPAEGAQAQRMEATNPPVELPRERRKKQQLAAAQGGPWALEKGAQAAPGKPAESMLGRRRGLEKQDSGGPGPSQRLKPGEDVELMWGS